LGARADLLAELLEAANGRVAGIFDGVKSQSPVPAVRAAAAALQDWRVDAVIPLGGGSATVTARAANILLCERRELAELATRYREDGSAVSPKLTAPKLPMVAVPTTATPSTSKAGSAVVAPGRGTRHLLFDPKTRAGTVLVDTRLLDETPVELLRDSALSALTVSVEGLVSRSANPFSDGLLLGAVHLLGRLLPQLDVGDSTAGIREELVLAGLQAGEGSAGSGGLTTALSHVIGHQIGAHNGIVDAILLPHVVQRLPAGVRDSLALVARILCTDGTDLSAELIRLTTRPTAPSRLRDLGVPADRLPTFAEEAMSEYAARLAPGRPTAADALDVLQAGW